MTSERSWEPASETIDDPRASPSDNACKTNPKVRVKPFPKSGIPSPSPPVVRGVARRCALVDAGLGVGGWGGRVGSSNPPNSTSASNSMIESFGDRELDPCMWGSE
jgi:hypothetical protein